MAENQSKSQTALGELIALLQEINERYLGPEWGLQTPDDVAGGARALMHLIQAGTFTYFEEHAEHPRFMRIVSPTRKITGDNADAVYYDAPVDPRLSYRVQGNTGGAVYTSLTVEAGAGEGQFGDRTAGVLNDDAFDITPSGDFEIFLGGPARARNWLALPQDACRVTARHYFENQRPAAADPDVRVRLEIRALDDLPPPPAPTDSSVAEGLARVTNFVRSRTLEMPPPGQAKQPAFVALTPNTFPKPVPPGDFALAAADAAYSMAPYVLGPDDALVIEGRWPTCRCANVSLWNRHMQTYDYANRSVSLNRTQTKLLPDGRFRMLLAHTDPGLPNWLDTENRPFGMVFWRFMLPEGEIETPEARVVPFASLQAEA